MSAFEEMTEYEFRQHVNTLHAGQDTGGLAELCRELARSLRDRTSVGREMADYINRKGICPAPRILAIRAPWLYEKEAP